MQMGRPASIPKLEKYVPSRFMLPTSHYDEKKADRAVRFIENLKHTNQLKGLAGREHFAIKLKPKIIELPVPSSRLFDQLFPPVDVIVFRGVLLERVAHPVGKLAVTLFMRTTLGEW